MRAEPNNTEPTASKRGYLMLRDDGKGIEDVLCQISSGHFQWISKEGVRSDYSLNGVRVYGIVMDMCERMLPSKRGYLMLRDEQS